MMADGNHLVQRSAVLRTDKILPAQEIAGIPTTLSWNFGGFLMKKNYIVMTYWNLSVKSAVFESRSVTL